MSVMRVSNSEDSIAISRRIVSDLPLPSLNLTFSRTLNSTMNYLQCFRAHGFYMVEVSINVLCVYNTVWGDPHSFELK